jgi:hypothetical protein
MVGGGAGGLKKYGMRERLFTLDKSKFPRVFIQKCIMCALYLGTKFITELGHDIAA